MWNLLTIKMIFMKMQKFIVFTNVNRGVEHAMQDSFIDYDYSQEASNYSADDYGPSKEIIDEFEDSAKKRSRASSVHF